MLKTLAIIVLFSVACVENIGAQAAANPAHKGQDSNQPALPVSAVVVPKQGNSPAFQTDAQQEQDRNNPKSVRIIPPARDNYDWFAYWANILLVAVGISGIIIAACTLKKIERQTAATEKQATHMVASERPFLMIYATGYEIVEFRAVNRGKSPAQIVFFNDLPNLDTPLITKEWNPTPHYGKYYDVGGAEIINIQWLAPGDEPMLLGSYLLSAIKDGWPERWEEIRHLQRYMYLWGTVKYRGLHAPDIYESRYCYMVRSAGPLMKGPPGLNRYT